MSSSAMLRSPLIHSHLLSLSFLSLTASMVVIVFYYLFILGEQCYLHHYVH